MRIHYLQHIASEGPGYMKRYLSNRGHLITATRLFAGEALPSADDIDWLIVMGGPMSVHDEAEYPWLTQEKKFIREILESDKPVLGICLGAQLIAAALGARVAKNRHREIGWFPVDRHQNSTKSKLLDLFPSRFEALHWHGDTFTIPSGAIPIGYSEACQNQGYIIDDRVVGLQFHLEFTPAAAHDLITVCCEELDNSSFVQTAEQILADSEQFRRANKLMESLLAGMITANSDATVASSGA
jgi:GMP synthase-like glutamine amidotransferase